tara:strand:+ start:141 stop:866 length:726 start_codon:yes stop_codon:yes gene_type:complete
MTKLIETKSIILFLLFSNLLGQDKGQKLFEQEKYDEARKYYESILEKRDEDKAALFGVGSSAYYQNDIEGALNSFGNTLDSEDNQLKSKSYYNLARILQDKSELEKSLALYRKSLELDPTDIDAKFNYELLKRQISQNQKDENQKDENQSNEQNSERNENENSEKEDENNELAEQNKKEQEESKGDKQDETSQNNPGNEGENKSDELMQAEAILNALKDQEKINQKQKILKTKSLKFDKDW